MITDIEMENFPTIQKIIYYFQELDKIPRGSKNEEQVVQYLIQFAKNRELDYYKDNYNNIIISKKATDNSNNFIAFQSHTDMVCEKTNNSNHDFSKDPIDLNIVGDFIKSKETSIGADNGIGVAYMLTILDSDQLIHPNLEMIFTSDEESSMTGAKNIDLSNIKSKRIISLDAFNDNTIIYGCASNYSRVLKLNYKQEKNKLENNAISIKIDGFIGGHSGIDINKGRGNPIISIAKIMSDLQKIDENLVINDFDSGTWVTAIPRNAKCTFTSSTLNIKKIKNYIKLLENIIRKQYKNEKIVISISKENYQDKCFDSNNSKKIINYLLNFPNGVLMCDENNEVIFSTNIGTIFINDESLIVENSIRSNLPENKTAQLVNKIINYDKKNGFITTKTFDFPGYVQQKDTDFINFLSATYNKIYKKEPTLKQEHILLEGSWFAKKLSNLEYVSISPNIYYAHSSNEIVSLSSIIKMWEYIKLIMERYNKDLSQDNIITKVKK